MYSYICAFLPLLSTTSDYRYVHRNGYNNSIPALCIEMGRCTCIRHVHCHKQDNLENNDFKIIGSEQGVAKMYKTAAL